MTREWCIQHIQGVSKTVEKELELQINKVIRSDNKSEFKNAKVDKYCNDQGIKHEFVAKYTPQQNGLVQSKNKTIIDMARC